MTRWLPLVLFVACAAAEVRSGRFQSRDAWIVDTPRLRVAIMQSGGHVAEIALKEEGATNPLWVQRRPTIDAEQWDAAKHAKLYGGGAGARLMSGLLGHNLCFPYWGNPSEEEARAGMTFHGETGVVRWKRTAGAGDSLTVSAELPESRMTFTRMVSVEGDVVWFDETAENLSAWDRPVGWCEHVTLGPPFLEKGTTEIEASLTRGRLIGDESGKEFQWPSGDAGPAEQRAPIDLRRVRTQDRSGFVNNFLVDPARRDAFFAAYHPGRRLVFGYVFQREEFPWLNIWEANNPDMLTRGMEFSNTPLHGTAKALARTASLFGAPTYEWLNARARMRKRFAAFSLRTPAGYRGVADVRWRERSIEIVEKETGRVATLAITPAGR